MERPVTHETYAAVNRYLPSVPDCRRELLDARRSAGDFPPSHQESGLQGHQTGLKESPDRGRTGHGTAAVETGFILCRYAGGDTADDTVTSFAFLLP